MNIINVGMILLIIIVSVISIIWVKFVYPLYKLMYCTTCVPLKLLLYNYLRYDCMKQNLCAFLSTVPSPDCPNAILVKLIQELSTDINACDRSTAACFLPASQPANPVTFHCSESANLKTSVKTVSCFLRSIRKCMNSSRLHNFTYIICSRNVWICMLLLCTYLLYYY